MSEENIQIFMGDFMKNAGIAGMYYMLGASEAVRGVDYGISDDQQSLWISRQYALQADWTDLYFQGFVSLLSTSTVYQGVLERIDDVISRIDQEQWKGDKEGKEQLKFINEKLWSNSYQNGFANIKNRVSDPEVYEKLKKEKLNEKMEPEDLKKRLIEIRSFLEQPLCKETFVMKSLAYNYINRFWSDKCFLLRSNAKKDMKEVFEADFSTPLRAYWGKEHEKSKELCIECGNAMDPKEKVSIAFMKDAGDDLTRKQSAFWNCKVDAYLCPVCAFLYALSPLGFQLLGNRFLFINNNYDLKALLDSNSKDSRFGMESERKEDERLPSWFSRMMNMLLEGKEQSFYNIQVVLKSTDDKEHYLFQVINKEIIRQLRDDNVKNILRTLGKHPFYRLDGEMVNVYEEAVFNILQYNNQYDLVNRLLRESLNTSAASTEIPAYLTYHIELRCRKIRSEGEEGKYMKIEKLADEGNKLRQELTKNYSEEMKSDVLRGVTYQLLNALALNNSQKFFDIAVRMYSSTQLPTPSGFVDMLKDPEQFQAGGYAFVLGLRGSYSWKGQKEEKKEERS